MTRSRPHAFGEFSTDLREDELAAEMAKISLMEEMIATMDDRNELLEAQVDALETIAKGDN